MNRNAGVGADKALGLRLHGLLAVLALLSGCSPVYVVKAGWAEAKILWAREPLADVILDPETEPALKGKLTLAVEARRFAQEDLGFSVGDSYTTFSRLESDTLAMVLSASRRDRMEPKLWWFPIVGRVPYRGFFDLEDALGEQRKLEAEGLDTHLRPTAAFSTLGWFSDPILSTMTRYDEVELVTVLLHELSHRHLYVPGETTFNESFATWVGRRAAIRFFCEREGGGPDTRWCGRAKDRWEDTKRFGVFIEALAGELRTVYGDADIPFERKLSEREEIFGRYLERFDREVAPELASLSYRGFRQTPLNNATLLGRIRYYHRLGDFDAFLAEHGGSLRQAVSRMKAGLSRVEDPFDLLGAP